MDTRMKLYKTTCIDNTPDAADNFLIEFSSSASDASKARTRLKKEGLRKIVTDEINIETTRSELIIFLNKMTAHVSWVPVAVAAALSRKS